MIVNVSARLKVTPEVSGDLTALRDILATRIPDATCTVDETNGWVLVTFVEAAETVV